MIAGVVKSFNVPFDYALHEMSFVNLTMYLSTLPSYSSHDDKEKGKGRPINASDPRNSAEVNKILFG